MDENKRLTRELQQARMNRRTAIYRDVSIADLAREVAERVEGWILGYKPASVSNY